MVWNSLIEYIGHILYQLKMSLENQLKTNSQPWAIKQGFKIEFVN